VPYVSAADKNPVLVLQLTRDIYLSTTSRVRNPYQYFVSPCVGGSKKPHAL